jgi:hypothetical protein
VASLELQLGYEIEARPDGYYLFITIGTATTAPTRAARSFGPFETEWHAVEVARDAFANMGADG